jgi:lysophospholipase L1-like esterase
MKGLWILLFTSLQLAAQPTEPDSGVSKYAPENLAEQLKPVKGNRIVFLGDSITELWKILDPVFFTQNNYVNRGISGQTTGQMLQRFEEDVVQLKPAVVVILGGINDIAQNAGPVSLEDTYKNLIMMAEKAKAHKIRVVLCSVLPANEFTWHPGLEPAGKVIRLNAMLKHYAKTNKLVYVDYHAGMVDKDLGLQAKLSPDGVHPNAQGYKIMKPLLQKAIAKALKQK